MSVWFCLASGPSMCPEDAAAVQGRGKVIAINNTIQLACFADVLYSADPMWWKVYEPLHKEFSKCKVGLRHPGTPSYVHALDWACELGLGLSCIHTGNNSGYQAINYAFLEGAKTIVLLGYDMEHKGTQKHWHSDHPTPLGNFNIGMPELCAPKFTALAADLRKQGVRVINASRHSALTCFERIPLHDVIAQLETPASAG